MLLVTICRFISVLKKQRNISVFQKIKGRTYRNYNKVALQSFLSNENWEPFYELNDPIDLWDFIQELIESHINIMCPIQVKLCIYRKKNSGNKMSSKMSVQLCSKNVVTTRSFP